MRCASASPAAIMVGAWLRTVELCVAVTRHTHPTLVLSINSAARSRVLVSRATIVVYVLGT